MTPSARASSGLCVAAGGIAGVTKCAHMIAGRSLNAGRS